MTKVGEHITLDIIGTIKEYEPKFFEKLVYKIAKKAKVTVLEISKYKFEPQGFTLVALLAESHISFHTFPEKKIISFDFFTCGKVNPIVALDIIKKDIKHQKIVKKENPFCPKLHGPFENTPESGHFRLPNPQRTPPREHKHSPLSSNGGMGSLRPRPSGHGSPVSPPPRLPAPNGPPAPTRSSFRAPF